MRHDPLPLAHARPQGARILSPALLPRLRSRSLPLFPETAEAVYDGTEETWIPKIFEQRDPWHEAKVRFKNTNLGQLKAQRFGLRFNAFR